MEFKRCLLRFEIKGIIFKCDLQNFHSGCCISLPDGIKKVATVIWNKSDGF